MGKLCWSIEKRKVSDLKISEENPRKISPESFQKLKERIEKRGFHDIIKVDKDNNILSGNQRTVVLKELGYDEIDVRVPSRKLTESERQKVLLESNINDGEWDNDLLIDFPQDVLDEVGLDITFPDDTEIEEDEVPEPQKEAISKLGDLYQLGNHRLMCGDSTNEWQVEALMGGCKANMIFTDPPYNVDYGISKNPRHKIRTIKNDALGEDDWEQFCKSLYSIFLLYNTGDIYMWGASGPEGMKMRLWLIEMGCHWSATIVWKKQQLVLSPAKYQRMYEPCFYGWFDKSSFCADRKQTEVWEFDRPHNSKLHPTMKPIELCGNGIKNSSKQGDVVLDLFGGSGSTLIACEQLNRKCYMMELDPIYVDVIIKRWENLTGKKAERIATHSTKT